MVDYGSTQQDNPASTGHSLPTHAPMIIIGSGPAGYTAAVYAARAMLRPMLISGFEPGGQLMITSEVENYPGFADAIQGPWLMEQMRTQAEHVGFALRGDSGTTYTADTLVIATGARAKWLCLPSEEKFKGYGVSACATCDGFFYRGKDVVVVGGGNSAVEEALYLSQLASHVTVVHRRDAFKAARILQDRLFKQSNVDVLWDHAVAEILGTDAPLGVTGVRLESTRTGAVRDLATHGVFVAIGHQPATDLFHDQLTLKANGYIATAPNSTATNIPGVFAAGDVTDDVWRQAVTAAGMGCMAALEADRWLALQIDLRAAAE